MSDHAQPFVLAGVMGWPVAHSRSPLIHSHWIAQYGLRGAYVPLAVQPDTLQAALRALPVLGFAGCNLTIPHKIAAIGIVDALEPLARRIGAANTTSAIVACEPLIHSVLPRRLSRMPASLWNWAS